MAKLIQMILASSIAFTAFAPASMAQPLPNDSETISTSSGPRRQMATIIFSGLAGAILGLSTLSFYGRPQDKLSNIAIGFALGIIAGATFTTYKAATQPYDYLDSQNRNAYDQYLTQNQKPPVALGYSWDF